MPGLTSRLPLAAATSMLALAIALPANAQGAGEADPGEDRGAVEEVTLPDPDDTGPTRIVVTAQFREQELQDTPLAITAVDAAMLSARNQDDIEAVARQAPSVTLNEMGGAYGASLGASIRGIGQFDFNPAYEPGVGFYIDNVYYASLTGANFDLLDLERVEILRGPQGTLTGRNSIGGAIKLFSQKPVYDTSGFVEASYGARDRLELRGGVNFPISENMYARLSAVHKEQDGYVEQRDYGCDYPDNPQGIAPTIGANPGDSDSCVLNMLGDQNYSGVRGALRFEPAESVDLMVIADYQRSDRLSAAETPILVDSDGSRPVAPGAPAPYAPPEEYLCGPFCTYASWSLPAAGQSGGGAFSNRNKFEGWSVSGHADVDLSDSLQLQSITAYREYNNQWGTDDDYTPDPAIGAGGFNDLDFWFFSQELRLNGELGDLAEFTLGAFYSDQSSVYFTQQDIRYIIPGVPLQFVGDDTINADTKAGFGTVIFYPTDALTLTGGIRYTDEHKDYTFVRRNYDGSTPLDPDPFGLAELNGLTSVYDGDRWDWRLSADYRFSEAVLAYATVGTGFKGGGVTARPFIPQHAIEGTFGPETVTAYEAGLKTDLFRNRVRFNVAVFYNEYQDIQLGLSDCSEYGGGTCAVVANAGDGTIQGVEAELYAEPIDGLMIDGSLTLLDSEYDTISEAVGASVGLDDPIVSPETQFSVGAQYEIDLGMSGTLTPRFDMAYRGEDFRGRGLDAEGLQYRYADDYVLGNAKLTYRNEERDLAVSLEMTNVFDVYYQPFRFDAVYGSAGTAYAQVGEPREWRVSVRKDF